MNRSPHDLSARRGVGVMMQEVALADALRVRDHIAMTQAYYPDPLTLAEAIALAGVEKIANRPYAKLSGGQKRQAQFALAICGRPRLLFLDEPTTGLDLNARENMWATLRGLVAAGTTIILTTHYIEEAEALADRVVVLAKGRQVAQGTVEEMRALVVRKRIAASPPSRSAPSRPGHPAGGKREAAFPSPPSMQRPRYCLLLADPASRSRSPPRDLSDAFARRPKARPMMMLAEAAPPMSLAVIGAYLNDAEIQSWLLRTPALSIDLAMPILFYLLPGSFWTGGTAPGFNDMMFMAGPSGSWGPCSVSASLVAVERNQGCSPSSARFPCHLRSHISRRDITLSPPLSLALIPPAPAAI